MYETPAHAYIISKAMPSVSCIFSVLLTLAVFANGIYCNCTSAAMSIAATQPAEPPCCGHAPGDSKKQTPAHSHDNDGCPHCNQTRSTAESSQPANAKHIQTLERLPMTLVAFAIVTTPTAVPAFHFIDGNTIAAPLALPLRLHCALTL